MKIDAAMQIIKQKNDVFNFHKTDAQNKFIKIRLFLLLLLLMFVVQFYGSVHPQVLSSHVRAFSE